MCKQGCSLGHRRIGYIGDRFGHQSNTERLTGYQRVLKSSGLRFRPQLAVDGDGKPVGGETALAALLGRKDPPTAVFCYNDLSALGAMRAARNLGLQLPEDLSLVGFDDLYISEYLSPALTTIRQPMRQMGRMAMETLLHLTAGQTLQHNLKVPGELIVRDSCGAPGRRK